jgi:hypothetical protein
MTKAEQAIPMAVFVRILSARRISRLATPSYHGIDGTTRYYLSGAVVYQRGGSC